VIDLGSVLLVVGLIGFILRSYNAIFVAIPMGLLYWAMGALGVG